MYQLGELHSINGSASVSIQEIEGLLNSLWSWQAPPDSYVLCVHEQLVFLEVEFSISVYVDSIEQIVESLASAYFFIVLGGICLVMSCSTCSGLTLSCLHYY